MIRDVHLLIYQYVIAPLPPDFPESEASTMDIHLIVPPTLPPKPKISSATPPPVEKTLEQSVLLLPEKSLQELLETPELLKGYLAHEPEFKKARQQQIDRLEEYQTRLNHLLEEFNELNKPGGIKYTANQKLRQLTELEQEHRRQEARMLQKLKSSQVKYKEVLQDKLNAGIKDQERVAASLVESLKGDENVASFVEEYRRSREKYHFRSEALKRLQEDRIGGVV